MDQASNSSVVELANHGQGVDVETEMETDASKVAEHQEYADALSVSGSRSRRQGRWNRRSCSTRKLISVCAIFFALMLIVGAIFLHLRQKHHLGRLHTHLKHHRSRLEEENAGLSLVTAPGVASTQSSPTTFLPLPPTSTSTSQLSSECLSCLATTATDNVPAVCKGKVHCGIYRISRIYWQDARERIDAEDSLAHDYEGCLAVDSCAERMVRSYVQRFASDCNGDGRIGCRDHIMLHMLGPGGCRMHKPLEAWVARRMEQCFELKEIL
ncbi:hypothetical protein KR009_008213 [Drosophila setifemur]|nr:hypothetical protein KR009_008213 [Drosophila setifemur]